jgi:cytochrome c-type biogenesis protein CcmH
MVSFGVVSALAFALVGGVAWWLLAKRLPGAQLGVGVLVGALWLTSLATTWGFSGRLGTVEAPSVSGAALAWPVAPSSPLVSARNERPATAGATQAAMQASSVESLVGGLETRLAANPNDANGWALLAQSYAYTANQEATERAVRRAVELGVDEATLRERVDNARRSAHAGDWGDHTVISEGR